MEHNPHWGEGFSEWSLKTQESLLKLSSSSQGFFLPIRLGQPLQFSMGAWSGLEWHSHWRRLEEKGWTQRHPSGGHAQGLVDWRVGKQVYMLFWLGVGIWRETECRLPGVSVCVCVWCGGPKPMLFTLCSYSTNDCRIEWAPKILSL